MPAQQRKRTAPKPAATVTPEGPQEPATDLACLDCFPGGRLPDGVFTAGCEHGVYTAQRD